MVHGRCYIASEISMSPHYCHIQPQLALPRSAFNRCLPSLLSVLELASSES